MNKTFPAYRGPAINIFGGRIIIQRSSRWLLRLRRFHVASFGRSKRGVRYDLRIGPLCFIGLKFD